MNENEMLVLNALREKLNAKKYIQILCGEMSKMVEDTLSTLPNMDAKIVDQVLDLYMDEIRTNIWEGLTWSMSGADWRDDIDGR